MAEQTNEKVEDKPKNPVKKSGSGEKKKELKQAPVKNFAKKLTKNEWEILSHPLMTEKSIGLIEKENKLVFIVNVRSNKVDIKSAVEKAFDSKVDTVTTAITRKGQKKAYVKLAKDFSASEIATRLGML